MIDGRRHAAEDLPLTVDPDPSVGNPRYFRTACFAGAGFGPAHCNSIMIDRDVAGNVNSQWLDRVGL